MSRRAVFLDRDGVLNRDSGFIKSIEELELFSFTAGSLHLLNEAGFLVVVITNQSGVARGYFSEETLVAINNELIRRLEREGARLDGIYYCPHLEDGKVEKYSRACDCRKPLPGLIFLAARELGIDLSVSFSVGDSERDIEAGAAAGCRTVLISPDEPETAAEKVVPSLAEAVEWIIGETGG